MYPIQSRGQRGQGGTEYALLLASISLVIIFVSGALFTVVKTQFRNTLCEMDSNGRVQYECNEGVEPGMPIASFTVTCPSLSCTIDAAGSRDTNSDGTGTIVSYVWYFGDSTSTTGTDETPAKTYAANGTYTITLVVTDDDGNTATTTRSVYAELPNNAPTPNFTFSCTNLLCTFNAGASLDSDGSIASYEWTFGDGNTGTGVSANHNYATSGSRTVTLKVTDNGGKAATTSKIVTSTVPANLIAHIADLDKSTSGSNSWQAIVTITVRDGNNAAMSGAQVYGSFNNGGGSHNCTTLASGICQITSQSVAGTGGSAVASLTFTVSNITNSANTYEYNSSANENTDGDGSNGTTITISNPSNVAPVANFSFTCNYLVCSFDASILATDSDGTISSYAWNFGDSTTGTGSTASRTYAAAGNYNVTLTVTDNAGASTTSAPKIVTATAVVGVLVWIDDVDATGTTGSGNKWTLNTLTFHVRTASNTPVSGAVISVTDATPITKTCTTNAYGICTTTGHSVLLNSTGSTTTVTINSVTVTGNTYQASSNANTDSDGHTISSNTITIGNMGTTTNAAPVANFTVSCTALTCTFTSTSNDDGTISSYAWNFGDTTTGTGSTVSRTYTAAGSYNVTLTVTDNQSATGTVTQSASPTSATNAAPVANFTVSCTALVCSFNATTSTDSDGTISNYAWNFGDSTTGTGSTASRTYTAAGSYTVTLTVTDNLSATGTTTKTASPTAATNAAPVANFTVSCTAMVCSFNATTSTDSDGTITGYAWNFGDSTTGIGSTASRTYMAAGSYTVTLTVTDNLSATGTTTKTATPTSAANASPVANFTVSCTALVCSFNATTSTDSDGTITGYAWNFGDSTTGIGSTASRTYAAAGSYTVTLTVTDNLSATGTTTKTATPTSAANVSPVASFTVSCTNLVCSFNAAASTDSDGTINNYAWNFGDSTTGTGSSTSRTYATAGSYTVTLTVTDNLGATGTITKTATPTAPIVNIWIDDVDATGTNGTGNKWTLNTITFHVRDTSGNISGALISVTHATAGTKTCTTVADGTCTMSGYTVLLNNASDSTPLTVNSVTLSGYTYLSSSNTNTDGDGYNISNNTITINNPN